VRASADPFVVAAPEPGLEVRLRQSLRRF